MCEEKIKDESFYELPMDATKIFKACLEKGLIKSKREKAHNEIKRKPSWYKDEIFFLYHKFKGHSTDGCIIMKKKVA